MTVHKTTYNSHKLVIEQNRAREMNVSEKEGDHARLGLDGVPSKIRMWNPSMTVAVFGDRVFREAVAVREAAGRAQNPP